MTNEEATQCTQNVVDPRRMGRNNSGLNEADISDVMCILHPCSPAAFMVVAMTAERTPHNVLQNDGFQDYDDGLTQSVLEEQETFILSSDAPIQAMDLALRFSASTMNPSLGFVFGRNPTMCDIVLATDTAKRVSNVHFSISINDSGILMLQDLSTNGTMVDDVLLRGKANLQPQKYMLNSGSIIQILSPKADEIVKFIVRIPSREGHVEEYEAKFNAHRERVAAAQARARNGMIAQRLVVPEPKTQSGGSMKAPFLHNHFGMHWSGGDRYNVVGLIGKGAFATVYQLATKSEGQLFAAKELEKRKFMKNGVLDRKLDNEMQIMKAISHPNIVQYVDYQDHANHLYIIMEFVPCGDLQQHLNLKGPLPEELGKKMAMQVLDSLSYLHAKKITHRDIKPDNILLADLDPAHFTVKLSDFGLSKVVKDNDTFLKTFCGTLLYCAPEVFPHYDSHIAGRGQKRPRKGAAQMPSKFHSYSQSVDIWSFGAVLWYSLCAKPPFEGVADNTGRGMFDKIMMTPLDPADLVKQGVSDDAVALLLEMLNTDPASRPSPSYCLHHRWFGLDQTSAIEGATERGLVAIAEEDEGQTGDEPDMSGLSLDERGSSQGSYYDEASIHSGSLNFFDPRQSKRVKTDGFAYREPDDIFDSSPELLHQPIPLAPCPEGTEPAKSKLAQRKLFGEISRSALNGDGVVSDFAHDATGNAGSTQRQSHESDGTSEQGIDRGNVTSPSLLGAESLLREVHMDSPCRIDSLTAHSNEPATPRTPSGDHGRHRANGTANVYDDITPKQPQTRFNRQINLPIPASFFFDPYDPATHTLEYASKVSGHDFVNNPRMIDGRPISLPATMNGSATEDEHDEHRVDTDVENEAPSLLPAPSEFTKPPPRLGRLVSTPESFASIVLNLNAKLTLWGRSPDNTYVYPDKNETRVPKRGVSLWFHAPGIEKIAEDGAWTKLPGLHCIIATESSQGIAVNGVLLKKGEPGKTLYGRVYTGDSITIWPRGPDGKPGLEFTCDFFHGEGRERRPDGEPRFRIQTERGSKGKEKENGRAPTEEVAA